MILPFTDTRRGAKAKATDRLAPSDAIPMPSNDDDELDEDALLEALLEEIHLGDDDSTDDSTNDQTLDADREAADVTILDGIVLDAEDDVDMLLLSKHDKDLGRFALTKVSKYHTVIYNDAHW